VKLIVATFQPRRKGFFECEWTSWREGGAHGTLFIGRGGEVRGRGRQDGGGRWAASMVTVFEKGGARVPLDEANRGGMGGASL
jgi:hypothetical protein